MITVRTLNPAIPLDASSALELLVSLAERRGDAPAWYPADGSPPLGFRTLVDEARRTASWLASLGLAPGDRVATLTDALEPFTLMALGAALGGFTLVPLPTDATPSILASLLVRANPAAVLLSPSMLAALLPVFALRGDALPGLRVIDEAVGLLAPGLYALDEGRSHEDVQAPSPTAPPSEVAPLALFYNNGSRGRAEAAAVGFSQLRAALRVTRHDNDLGVAGSQRSLHGVVRVPTTAVGALFDLWRPLVLGQPVLDLSSLRGDAALATALARHRPRSLSLSVADVDAAFFAGVPAPGPAPLEAVRARGEAALVGLARLLDTQLPPSLVRRVSTLARPLAPHGVERAWFFRDMPPAAVLGRLRQGGVAVVRSYQVSECAVPIGVVADTDRAIEGYRVPAGVEVRILDPGPDGLGEIGVRTGALAVCALDATRALRPIQLTDGFLPTGDLGHMDAAGRLHVLGTETLALAANPHTVTSEELVARLADGPWDQIVPIPERLLWPEDAAESERWVAIVHGADKDAAMAFIRARNTVLAPGHRIHGVLCSPAPFPVGTHGRIRREALLGALRSAFAALAATPAGRARAIDWL